MLDSVSRILQCCMSGYRLLDLAHNLVRTGQRFYHLQALLSSADGVVALLQQLIQSISPIHVLQELSLHLILGELDKVEHDGLWNHVDHSSLDNVIV